MNYVQKIGQTFYARIVIPKDLRQHFRQKEFKKSLHTKSRKEAKQLLVKTLHEWQQQFFCMRYTLTMDQRPPSPEALAIFAKEYPEASPDPMTFTGAFGVVKQHWPVELMHIQDVLDMANPPAPAAVAPTVINNHYRTFNGLGGPAAPTAPVPTAPYTRKITVNEAVAAWLESPEVKALSGTKRGTQATYRNKVKRFTDPYGFRHLEEVNDYTFLTKFINEEIRGFSRSYRESILTIVTQMIKYHHQTTRKAAVCDQIAEPPMVKIIESAEERHARKSTKSNAAYSPEQLQALFNGFAETPAKRLVSLADRRHHLSTIYATVVALYTGFRVSDLKHFRASDFIFDETIPYIAQENRLVEEVQDNGEVVVSNSNKTANSIKLPMHKHLLSLDFGKYISLFKATDAPFSQISTIGQRLSAQLTSLQIKKNKQLMHSFKGTIDNKYLILGTPLEIKEYLMSHSGTGTRTSYNDHSFLAKTELPTINKYVQKLDYTIDFTALKAHIKEQLQYFA